MRKFNFILAVLIVCIFVSCTTTNSAKTETTEKNKTNFESAPSGLVIEDNSGSNQNVDLLSYIEKTPKMHSILEYIVWRGDLSFEDDSLNEIDALILSQLSYINYDYWVSSSFERKCNLKTVANDCLSMSDSERAKRINPLVNADTLTLLYMAGNSNRFGSLKLCGYTEIQDVKNEEQFSAVTFCFGNKWAFSAFRGTDDSLVGWKEDFNMAYLSPVPAQTDSVKYIEEVSKSLNCDLALGGHSKGGNLAIYAAAFCSKDAKDKIKVIYNFDGPGFEDSIIQSDEFKSIVPYIYTFVPKASIVGILFQHEGKCFFVENDEENGILQHNPFSWYVYGPRFVYVGERTAGSVFVDLTTKKWMSQLNKDQLEVFVNVLFDVLGAYNSSSISEIAEMWYKKPKSVIKYMNNLDPETKEVVLEVAHLLFYSAKENVPVVSELRPKRKLIK